jgi:lysophospholipase L1-like esterase
MHRIRFLALGDSYTIGESVPAEESWPLQLYYRLKKRGFPIENPVIVARTGWTTAELREGINQAEIQGIYQLVSLQIGVNNQYRGEPEEKYRREFQDLMSLSIEFAGGDPGRVVVLSIPDWSLTPFAEGRDRRKISEEIDAFNAVNRAEAGKAGVIYIDITPLSRQVIVDPVLVAPDGLHASAKMYKGWVEQVLEAIGGVFENKGSQFRKDERYG